MAFKIYGKIGIKFEGTDNDFEKFVSVMKKDAEIQKQGIYVSGWKKMDPQPSPKPVWKAVMNFEGADSNTFMDMLKKYSSMRGVLGWELVGEANPQPSP